MKTLIELTMDHLHEVCRFLYNIDKEGLIRLGGALGLNYPKLTRMKQLPEDIVAAWLRREDGVLEKSCQPTWENLVRALEETGQRGIAKDIKRAKHLDQDAFSQKENGTPKCHFSKLHLCLLSTLLVVAAIGLVYYFFPNIMYKFNLYHSKTLPYAFENFAGRENELGEVIKLVDFSSNRPNDFRIIDVIGSPGFGKSTLAIHVGHEMVRRGVFVLYIDLADFPSDQQVKQLLAEKIIESAQIYSKFAVHFDRLLRWAHECYQNTLLILDNCDEVLRDPKQMGEFQSTLHKLVEASRNLKILMTSRKEIVIDPYSRFYLVNELSLDASCELLKYREQNGIELTPDQRKQIANLTGSVPLALHVMKSLLDRIGAPSPDEPIKELAAEPIETLSPKDFQSNKQVKATFDLSYRYLDPELQAFGCQLTLFPGSFTEEAAVFVFGNVSESDDAGKRVRKSLQFLVGNSILCYDQRKKRYHYHQLIKDYLLHVQTEVSEGNSTKYFPSYCVHYAYLLTTALVNFKKKFEVSIAIVSSDRHNFHHLLNALKTMQLPAAVDEFFETAVAISSSVDIGLLNVRFPINDTHIALKNALIQFDFIVDNGLYYKDYPQAFIYFHYVQIMRLVSEREVDVNGIEAGVNVLAQRQNRIEVNRNFIGNDVYIDFFQRLSSYHSRLNHTSEVNECRSRIFVRTYAHLSTCLQEEQCTHVNVGISYYQLGDYTIAASLLEMALLERDINTMDEAHILTHLISSYSILKDQEKLFLNVNKLHTLHENILKITASEYFWHHRTVSRVMKIYEEQGFVLEMRELFEKVFRFVKEILPDQGDNLSFDLCCKANRTHLVFEDIHNMLKELYHIGQYTKVIEIAILMMDGMKKVEAAQPGVLPNKLKLQLIMGRAKLQGRNYSDGLRDIELVLETILSDSNGTYDHEDDKRIACWELFPRVVYLEPCYQIKAAILRSFVNFALIFFDLTFQKLRLSAKTVENSLQNHINTLYTSNKNVMNIELSHATELASTMGAFKYFSQINENFMPLQELRDFLEHFSVITNKILLNICVLSLRIITYTNIFWFLLDICNTWFKLMSTYYIVYCVRHRHWIKLHFIAEFCYYAIIVLVLCLPIMVVLKQPKQSKAIICALPLFIFYTIRVARDPRFKYETVICLM